MPTGISVALVEDRREIREGLRLLIDSAEGLFCCGAFRSAEEALVAVPMDARVILVDIGLPRMSGTECIRRLKDYPRFQRGDQCERRGPVNAG